MTVTIFQSEVLKLPVSSNQKSQTLYDKKKNRKVHIWEAGPANCLHCLLKNDWNYHFIIIKNIIINMIC